MSDPKLTDPFPDRASIDPKDPAFRDPNFPATTPAPSSGGMMWGWVAGFAVLALILVFMFSSGGNQTADNSAPVPQTSATRTQPLSPPAAPTAQRPTPAPSTTTGSGSTSQ